jgi:chromosome segregation ATPase
MGNVIAVMCGLCALLAVPSAHAQIYQCRDASGRTITSDRVVPECADRSVREYSRSGVLKREIPAPLSAGEKRKLEQQEAQRKAEADERERQRRADFAMLERYRSVDEIEMARQRALRFVHDQIERERAALTEAEKQWTQAQAKLASFNGKGIAPPATLSHQVETLASRLDEGHRRLSEYQNEAARINASFDRTVARFNELTDPSSHEQD